MSTVLICSWLVISLHHLAPFFFAMEDFAMGDFHRFSPKNDPQLLLSVLCFTLLLGPLVTDG